METKKGEMEEAVRFSNHKEESHQEMLGERTCLYHAHISKSKSNSRLVVVVLLSGRGSGLISPSRTSDCCCSNSTKARKRERLMRPTGSSRARMRAGAIGERGSIAMASTFGPRSGNQSR
jgi:hypothetical protein